MSVNGSYRSSRYEYNSPQNQYEAPNETRIIENFFKAAHYGNTEEIIKCIETKKIGINSQNKAGNTALHYAAGEGHKKIVMELLNYNADPRAKNSEGQIPLHLAAMRGHNICIIWLLDHARNTLNCKDNSGYTPLHCAAFGTPHSDNYSNSQGSSERVIKTLQKYSAEVNARSQRGATPLHLAAQQGHRKLVEALLDFPCVNPNISDIDGKTPLHIAVENRYFDIIDMLFKKGVDVNLKNNLGETPLFTAVRVADIMLTEKILNHKDTQVNLKNKDGDTALHLCVKKRLLETAKRLLESGAKINAENSSGHTPLHLAVTQDWWDGIDTLCAKEADVNRKNNHGCSPLHTALFAEQLKSTKIILNKGPSINVDTHSFNGVTPLHLAINLYIDPKNCNSKNCDMLLEIIQKLLEKGANPNLRSQNTTPQQLVREHNLKEIDELIKNPGLVKNDDRRAHDTRSRKRRRA